MMLYVSFFYHSQMSHFVKQMQFVYVCEKLNKIWIPLFDFFVWKNEQLILDVLNMKGDA